MNVETNRPETRFPGRKAQILPQNGQSDEKSFRPAASRVKTGAVARVFPDLKDRMSTSSTHDVTRLLLAWRGGDAVAASRLMPLVYDELRRLARDYLRRERGGHTLQPTALVHEAYLRLVDDTQVQWQGRAHFLGVAAKAMRRILVDHARAHNAAKRGGGVEKISVEDAGDLLAAHDVDLVGLDAALETLAQSYPRQSEVVELRFFGGLESREIAEMLQVSEKTILRDWNFAKLFLLRELDPKKPAHGSPG